MISSSTPPTFNTLNHVVYEKLNRNNFGLWKAQVWRDGTKKSPDKHVVVEKSDKTREWVPNPEC
jgi:hypothetical protein